MNIANTLAGLLVEEGQRSLQPGQPAPQAGQPAAGQADIVREISIAEPAVIPASPSRPNPPLYLALAAMLGLIGGLGLAFTFENLDSTIRSAGQLERLSGSPVLSSVPTASTPIRRNGAPILLNGTGRSSKAGEAFRMLGASTLSLTSGVSSRGLRHGRLLLVASAEPRDGKSTVVANLAATVAQAGHRVIIVDADLNHPSLHRLFAVENKLGLKELLMDSIRVPAALQDTKVAGLRVVASGSSAVGTEVLLNPMRLRQVLLQLAQEADLVLVDSSSVLGSADAAALAPMVDGVLMVVAQGRATEEKVSEALKQLDQVGGKTLGVILNKSGRDRSGI